jgi:predicted phosphodiesterase
MAKLVHLVSQEMMDSKEMLRVVCMSDTHEQLDELCFSNAIPDGDVLIHCGDFTHMGGKEQLEEFNKQLGTLCHKHKLVICG